MLAAFRKGLGEAGFSEGRNVEIEYRWANNEPDRLPDLAADLVRRRVAVIVSPGTSTVTLRRIDALLVAPQGFFVNRRVQIVTQATRHAVPAIYPAREFAEIGGLMSYGSNAMEQFRQTGLYTGRVLKGEKPADMPVLLASKFESVINVQTAKALNLEIPSTLLALADEVIE